jgi:hypothetical protein
MATPDGEKAGREDCNRFPDLINERRFGVSMRHEFQLNGPARKESVESCSPPEKKARIAV